MKKIKKGNKVCLDSYDAVIFDMDGVLVHSEPLYREVEQANFRKIGLIISEEEHTTYQGTATHHMWEIIKKKHGLAQSVEDLVHMTNSMVTPYFSSLTSLKTMPGVEKLIKELKKKNIPVALASSSYSDLIEIILRKTGFKGYFDVVIDSQMAGESKPSPGIFLMAAKKLGVAPDRCIVIEDSTNGIMAAKTAGMYCIAYAGPGSELQDQSNADEIISDFRELL